MAVNTDKASSPQVTTQIDKSSLRILTQADIDKMVASGKDTKYA